MQRHQTGFTLIELLAVMAIIGILAAIVLPLATSSTDAGEDARAQSSTSAVKSAVTEFVKEQTDAEILRSHSADVTASIVDPDGNSLDASGPTRQLISSHWPEKLITAEVGIGGSIYLGEFPTLSSPTDGVVTLVTVLDSDGRAIGEEILLADFTAIDFGVLTGETSEEDDPRSSSFLTERPAGSDTRSSEDRFHNFLWLFQRSDTFNSGSSGSRTVNVFKLERIEDAEDGPSGQSTVKLTYAAVTPNTVVTNGEPTPTPTPPSEPSPPPPPPAALTSLQVSPASGTVDIASTQHPGSGVVDITSTTQAFTASGTDGLGTPGISVADVVWSSSGIKVATIDSATGVAKGVSSGTVTITATKGTATGTASLTVTGTTSYAHGLVDQNNEPGGGFHLLGVLQVGQEFTPVAPILAAVDVRVEAGNPGDNCVSSAHLGQLMGN